MTPNATATAGMRVSSGRAAVTAFAVLLTTALASCEVSVEAGSRLVALQDANHVASGSPFPHVGADATVDAFYVGHSLISEIPDIAMSMANAQRRGAMAFREQNSPGAPLRWHWLQAAPGGAKVFVAGNQYQQNAHTALATGRYSHLVLTDGVPRGGRELENETVVYLGEFVRLARKHRPDIRIYYYETWPHLSSGTPDAPKFDNASPTRHLPWRARVDADAVMWDRIVQRVNEAHPAAPGQHDVKLIPAGRIMSRIAHAAVLGKIPGFQQADDFFTDGIHLNHYGLYAVAAIHFAVLTSQDPRGATAAVRNRWGTEYWGTRYWTGTMFSEPSAVARQAILEVIYRGLLDLYRP